ncbi:L-arabinose transport system permease protein AraQ [Oceanobacillus picturae]|jgi:multiple sugar transport system permease protein|uniref:L-arabinose transport system permease protein AraQ n=1 Tax=Oceanobacillus picturae TaxID=171693 RepID=W9ACU3_9BACI|nr:carbohydrate ABC transporter permease [Oceanobacillus picturae]NAO99376.1 ABC transporter permease subunit [Halomonas sp. MG34]RIU90496.1 carbohydrate ABC transporter permease [Oceanobacillus picturae]GAQ17664.1 L-arabinose transport system permease protein AraQ [Oceanobacillus picturae]CDO03544.1 L-arabinose transport system permease protein AraQ [Oceanobacillus picturae]
MKKITLLKAFIYIALTVLVIICFVPFYMMIVNATRSNSEILQGFTLIPGSAILDNYQTLISYMDVWRGFTNSLIVAVSVTVLNAYFSALTAFALVVYEFKWKNIIFVSFLVMMMVPGQLGLLGLYDLSEALGMLDSYWPLIIPAIAAPFTVFFFRQYLITTMHTSILEAGRIDGATELHMFHRIVLPLLMPAIATMGIFTFIGSWNNYITPLVILRSPELFTLPVMMGALRGSPVAMNLGAMYLGIAISVVPIMIAFLFLSRYIISSISAGAIKG